MMIMTRRRIVTLMKVRRLFKQYWPEMCLSMIDGDEDDEMKVKSFAKSVMDKI